MRRKIVRSHVLVHVAAASTATTALAALLKRKSVA
jgi:hypothetical protein